MRKKNQLNPLAVWLRSRDARMECAEQVMPNFPLTTPPLAGGGGGASMDGWGVGGGGGRRMAKERKISDCLPVAEHIRPNRPPPLGFRLLLGPAVGLNGKQNGVLPSWTYRNRARRWCTARKTSVS
jgi:hypothetical protein